MTMIDFSVKDVVMKRYSVRTFDKRPVEKEIKEKLMTYASELKNPLGPAIKVPMIEKKLALYQKLLYNDLNSLLQIGRFLCFLIPLSS